MAALAGFDEAGGASGYRPVDHSRALEAGGDRLALALRSAWLPRLKRGWFFKAETFFSVARYLDQVALSSGGLPPGFLRHSHGEGFLRFFEERCYQQGVYFFDEPESALSPARQVELLGILRAVHGSRRGQVVMATHSPLLMALPEATLLRLDHRGLRPVRLEETDHFRLLREFILDPQGFLQARVESQAELPLA